MPPEASSKAGLTMSGNSSPWSSGTGSLLARKNSAVGRPAASSKSLVRYLFWQVASVMGRLPVYETPIIS